LGGGAQLRSSIELWELTWPDLELAEVHSTSAAWAHNTWDCDLGLITCDSRFGSLHEVHSGETIWTASATLLVSGSFCGFLTGRWVRTAIVGIWAVALAVLLGVPDKIWDTRTQLVDLGAVAAVALLSTVAATLIERRRYHQIR
jgi:hypothetical protein